MGNLLTRSKIASLFEWKKENYVLSIGS